MSRTVIALLLLILASMGSAWILRSPSVVEPPPLEGRDVMISGFRSDGSLDWLLVAETASMENADASLRGVTLSHYPENGESVMITSDSLIRGSGGSSLSGSIRLLQGDELALETPSLYWDERSGVLESDSVRLTLGSTHVQAGGLHHTLREGVTLLTRGVVAETQQDSVRYVATAQAAEASSDRMTLLGGVTIESDVGDILQSLTMTTSAASSVIVLEDQVSGTWRSHAFSTNSLQISPSGVQLRGAVTIDLDLGNHGEGS